jgi:regulator of replication initiation timing
MNKKKTISILGLSVAFMAACLLLLAAWLYLLLRSDNGYTPNNNRQDSENKIPVQTPESSDVKHTRDSLQQLYAITTRDLDSQIDSARSNLDSLKSHLDNKLSESAGLRSEIQDILKNSNTDSEGMEIARQKITILQQKINELRRINSNVEIENRRLRQLLNQASRDAQNGNPALAIDNTGQKNDAVPRINYQSISISDLQLTAMQVEEDREKETTQAQQADKFVGSFMVKNTTARTGNAEIVVVVLQPDGQVLQNSTWESGTFDTKEGKRIYSLKVTCDHSKESASPYRFYLHADRFQKGNYTMQIYQNGTVIGRLVKTLS